MNDEPRIRTGVKREIVIPRKLSSIHESTWSFRMRWCLDVLCGDLRDLESSNNGSKKS